MFRLFHRDYSFALEDSRLILDTTFVFLLSLLVLLLEPFYLFFLLFEQGKVVLVRQSSLRLAKSQILRYSQVFVGFGGFLSLLLVLGLDPFVLEGP